MRKASRMTIDKMIETLVTAKEKVGGDSEIPFLIAIQDRDNEYFDVDHVVICEMQDYNGWKYDCALIGRHGGHCLSKECMSLADWKVDDDAVNVSKGEKDND